MKCSVGSIKPPVFLAEEHWLLNDSMVCALKKEKIFWYGTKGSWIENERWEGKMKEEKDGEMKEEKKVVV